MHRVHGIRSTQLLLVGLVLILSLVGASVAHATGFGELKRFGGPGTAAGDLTPAEFDPAKTALEFEPWHIFGVETTTNDVFVLEEHEESQETEKLGESVWTRFFRLQKLGANGEPLGHKDFKFKSAPSEGNSHENDAIEGIAVDAKTGILYFLVTEARPSEGPEEEEAVAASLYAWKTTPNAKKELEPAEHASKEGVLAGPETLEPTSNVPGKALLQPHGITVDPKTGEAIILAHDDECSGEECFEDELEPPLDHYLTQGVTEKGALGVRTVDTANLFNPTPAPGTFERVPHSPVVAGPESSERVLASQLLEPLTGKQEQAVDQFAEPATQLSLPDSSGLEKGVAEVGEGADNTGGAVAVSPDGKTLYGLTRVTNEEIEGGPIKTLGVFERSAETLLPIGWSGGQQPTTSGGTDKCVLEPSIFEGEHVQVAAGGNGVIFVLDSEYLREPATGSFPTKDAIIEFGPGGEGCPKASVKEIAIEVNGMVIAPGAAVPTGESAKLSSFVKQGDALSDVWEIEEEATHAIVTEPQTMDQNQTPLLKHTFNTPGKYKITEKIKTDNLETPELTITRSIEAKEKHVPIVITEQPKNAEEVNALETVKFKATATGKPTPSVVWKVSTNGGATFEEDFGKGDKGTESDTLEVPATDEKNGYEFFAEFTSAGEKVKTNTVILTIKGLSSAPKVTLQPVSTTVTEGETASFKAAASGSPPPTVQWEESSNGGSTWTEIGGATADELKVASTTLSENGREYRAVFKNGVGGSVDSNAATLTVKAKKAPTVTLQPVSATVTEGETASFKAEAEGSPTPTVQWEESSNGGSTFTAIGGATTDELKVAGTTLGESGRQYRAVFSNGVGGAVDSNAATLTVNAKKAPTVTLQPVSTTVTEGETASFKAAAEGNPTPTVQWEESSNGGATWMAIGGQTNDELKVAGTTLSENNREYRAVFSNGVGSPVDSSAATLTVKSAPKVTLQPVSATVTEGEPASFKAAASGSPAPTVQWEESSNGGSTWTEIGGATTDELKIAGTTLSENGREYRAVFKNGVGGSVDSNAATLTVKAKKAPTVTLQPVSATVTEGETASFKAEAEGSPTPTVQWEESSNGGSTFTAIGGATTDELKIAGTTLSENSRQYRAVFSNGVGGAVDSNAATLTVNKQPAVTPTPPGSPPNQPPPPPPPAGGGGVQNNITVAPKATLAAASLTVSSSGTAPIKISCPAGATCIGTITLRTLNAVSARAHAAKRKKSILTLATGAFSISGGGSRTITLHLSAAGRKLLGKSHVLVAKATISAHDPAGEKVTTIKVVTLRAAKHKH